MRVYVLTEHCQDRSGDEWTVTHGVYSSRERAEQEAKSHDAQWSPTADRPSSEYHICSYDLDDVTDLSLCDGCGNAYTPRRKPAEGRRKYCPACGPRKAQADASRDYRQRLKASLSSSR
jgi:hypothetical protein